MTSEAQVRVARGAEWLDAINPGWHNRIDCEAIRMVDCRRCIAGQLYGYYTRIFQKLPLEPTKSASEQARDLGFDTDDISYDDLRNAWIEQINIRKEKDNGPIQESEVLADHVI